MPRIPERRPVSDAFTGFVLQVGQTQALAFTTLPAGEVIASGQFIVRYGARFLGKLHVSIVPGLIVLDYGEMLTGEEAWEFLMKHSNLYPRSEVAGYRNDGEDDIVFIKQLDLSVPPQVLVYADEITTQPLAHPQAIIAADPTGLPERLMEYLPHYSTLQEWQVNRSHE